MSYQILIVSPADEALDAIPDSAFVDIDKVILLLSLQPELGRVYDPLYPAARLREELRVVYVGAYGLYYTVDHEHEIVRIRFIEDQRMDPALRFTGRLHS